MEFSFTLLGLFFIVLAWLVQVAFVFKGKKEIRPCFAGLYFLGVIFLVVDTYINTGGIDILSWLNIVTALGALILLFSLFRK